MDCILINILVHASVCSNVRVFSLRSKMVKVVGMNIFNFVSVGSWVLTKKGARLAGPD